MAKMDFNEIVGIISYYFGVIYLVVAIFTLLYIFPSVLSHFRHILAISTSEYALGNIVNSPFITVLVIVASFVFIIISMMTFHGMG